MLYIVHQLQIRMDPERTPRKIVYIYNFIPNTAVFGPTKLIGTTTTTARMTRHS